MKKLYIFFILCLFPKFLFSNDRLNIIRAAFAQRDQSKDGYKYDTVKILKRNHEWAEIMYYYEGERDSPPFIFHRNKHGDWIDTDLDPICCIDDLYKHKWYITSRGFWIPLKVILW